MMVQATRCYDCGSYVSREIYFGRFGKRNNVPLWVCPNCGVVHEDYRWFKYVSQQEANAIIEHRGPRGLFVLETGVEYIGIDNSTGDAWITLLHPPLIHLRTTILRHRNDVNARSAIPLS